MPEYTREEVNQAWSEQCVDLDPTLLFEKPEKLLSQGFTQIPNGILDSEDLSLGEKMTYTLLLRYAWNKEQCFPGHELLAKCLGVSRASIIKYMSELVNKGYIASKRRGQGKPNIYTILDR